MASDRAKRELAAYKRQGRTEAVVYRPAGGTARTIDALVRRGRREQAVNATKAGIEIAVLNDATLGIAPASMNKGSDQVDVAERFGGSPQSRRFTEIVEQDADWATLEVL